MQFYYYRITNIKNNRFYIGITDNLDKRWKDHKRGIRDHNHANSNIREDSYLYSLDDFKFEVIHQQEFDSTKDAYQLEYDLITKYKNELCYNIAQGGLLNPMYTPEIKAKMTKTKQSQVDNIIQIDEIEENHYKIIHIWNSMKEASKSGYCFRNIQKSVNDYTKGDGYYWVKEKELNQWKPRNVYWKSKKIAELNSDGEIIDVWDSPKRLEEKEKWAVSSICNAINRNGKTHDRKFIYIDDDVYNKYKPLIIEPVSTIPKA